MNRVMELCHNCDTKPVSTAKTDFIDRMSLLILRKLLKTKRGPKIPAYRLIRQFSITYKARRDGRRAFGLASISRTGSPAL